MRRTRPLWISALAGAFLLGLGLAGTARAAEPVVIGWQSDYAKLVSVGPHLARGSNDYIDLFKSQGGTIEGIPIEFNECTHDYDVNRSLECYERQKAAGMVAYALYGTPQTYSLTPKLEADHIPAISPGFGRADSIDGRRFPYLFPSAANYWSQATAAIKFIQDSEGGSLKGKKIALLFFDNPAGREPIPVFEMLAKKYGFEFRTFGVPSPGLEMGAQVTDMTRRYRADWIIGHMFGRAPSVSLKELRRKGFPLDHYIGFVWNTNESDVFAAGKETSKGALSISFTGLGRDFPIIKEIEDLYKKEGKAPSDSWKITGYYNRGIFNIALCVEAVRNAIKAFGPPITGEKVKKGFEMIKGFSLGGLLPPLEITPDDHEGGGWVRVYQWTGEKFILKKDWFKGDQEVKQAYLKQVEAAADKEKKE
jgi:branched-chain amino acid transport system substrate-binding protein